MAVSTSRHLNLSKSYFTGCTDAQSTKERGDKSMKIFTKPAKETRSIVENRLNEIANVNNGTINGNGNGNGKLSMLSITKSYKTYDNKVTSKQIETLPRKAWEQQK